MTIFCPSCGTANRDDADICSECGAIIPKSSTPTSMPGSSPTATTPADFGIIESYPPPPPPKEDFPPPPPPEQAFGIEVAPPPVNDSPHSPYAPGYPTARGQKKVCERCGTVLRPDETQCPGCGKPYQRGLSQSPSPYAPPQPYQPPPPPRSSPQPPPPRQARKPLPSQKPSPSAVSKSNIAKCARCGAIVYDYETRCSNCGRILAPPTKKAQKVPEPKGHLPPGAARCSRCNAIVYPHQTVCPKCGKPLAPVSTATLEPSQRISRCKRCGHIVYPTDTVCSNCGRKLDPI